MLICVTPDEKMLGNSFLKKKKPKIVIIAAAKVGGVHHNNIHGADFIYENLQIQNNLIHGSFMNNVKKVIFLGSSCIYPKNCKQPMKEKYLLSGKLEETNDAYAIAKIAGIYMCANYSKNYDLNYKSLMPPNMYGPGDNYNLQNSHFFSALINILSFINLELIPFKEKSPLRLSTSIKPSENICIFIPYFLFNETCHLLISLSDSSLQYVLLMSGTLCSMG